MRDLYESVSAYKTRLKVVDCEPVRIFEAEINGCNNIRVAVGTTGKRGGDSGYGGRTFLKITDLAATVGAVTVNQNIAAPFRDLEIMLEGDSELETFLIALKFAVNRLESYLIENPRE